MKVEYSAPKTKKKADARQRCERLTITAENDREQIVIAWIRQLLGHGLLQNLHLSAYASVENADIEMGGVIRARKVSEFYRPVKNEPEPLEEKNGQTLDDEQESL